MKILVFALLLTAVAGQGTVRRSGGDGGTGGAPELPDVDESEGPIYVGDGDYLIGVGRADVTGPSVEVNMMGYANPSQTAAGIHFRLYSRAFIVADRQNTTRTVFVNADACMSAQVVKLAVVKKLNLTYGDLYNETNVMISGTHTHSGAAGFLQYVLYDVTSLGFIGQAFNAQVDGIVKSIDRAHQRLQPGFIYENNGELLDSNINRSPTAYENNPIEERNKYEYNVDKNMTILKFENSQHQPIGMISWFPVHCTSMNNTNRYLSGDNKGHASALMEARMNPGYLPGKGPFVGAFAQGHEGDVSPNTKGAKCIDTGVPCERNHSTCGGKNENCIAFGPGKDMVDSTRIIAENQFKKAVELFNHGMTLVPAGGVKFRHQYINMADTIVKVNSTTFAKTCPSAMGFSFAAGTTDGPGAFDFTQGDTEGNAFWNLIRDLIKKPSADQTKCHHPKPILLDTGEMSVPYAWQPQIVPVHLFQWGSFYMAGVPGEFTTMSGRRTMDAIQNVLVQNGIKNSSIVIAGLANAYSSYIATYEEYQIQRYEGASTIYGPHTLQAYIQQFINITTAMMQDVPSAAGPPPPYLLDKQLSFLPPVIFDHAPLGSDFGDILVDAETSYNHNDTVKVTFVGANPRNDIHADSTFLEVLYKTGDNEWQTTHTDSSWETFFHWRRTSTLLGESEVDVMWTVPPSSALGEYRIGYYGNTKDPLGHVSAFTGFSRTFTIAAMNNIIE